MEVKYINFFLEATNDILKQIIGQKLEINKPFLKNASYPATSLVILIGLTGSINGQVVLCFDKESCLYIASQMMGGMKVTELDEIAKSAVSELCNMIMGTASTIFSQQQLEVNITPPTTLSGNNLEISHEGKVVCIPMNLISDMKIEMNLAIKDVA